MELLPSGDTESHMEDQQNTVYFPQRGWDPGRDSPNYLSLMLGEGRVGGSRGCPEQRNEVLV